MSLHPDLAQPVRLLADPLLAARLGPDGYARLLERLTEWLGPTESQLVRMEALIQRMQQGERYERIVAELPVAFGRHRPR
jgi:hypothetical protein